MRPMRERWRSQSSLENDDGFFSFSDVICKVPSAGERIAGMNIKMVLFDLDGTLLPMDQDAFTEGYFRLLAQKMEPHGYDAKQLVNAIWAGTAAMVKNDGSRSNEEAFWEKFVGIYGEKAEKDKPLFDAFYRCEFQKAKEICGFEPQVPDVIRKLKAGGMRLVLATNPIFPAIATESRIRWAGLSPEDFEWYTTYENIGYCKPNPEYYREILRQMKMNPENCLMVGNDVTEDTAAEAAGVKVFLLTDCLINWENVKIDLYPHGSFQDLMRYIEKENGSALS